MTAPLCPYCTQGGKPCEMIGRGGSETWYLCVRCGHLALPTDPTFECVPEMRDAETQAQANE